jgi:hypothetical protein
MDDDFIGNFVGKFPGYPGEHYMEECEYDTNKYRALKAIRARFEYLKTTGTFPMSSGFWKKVRMGFILKDGRTIHEIKQDEEFVDIGFSIFGVKFVNDLLNELYNYTLYDRDFNANVNINLIQFVHKYINVPYDKIALIFNDVAKHHWVYTEDQIVAYFTFCSGYVKDIIKFLDMDVITGLYYMLHRVYWGIQDDNFFKIRGELRLESGVEIISNPEQTDSYGYPMDDVILNGTPDEMRRIRYLENYFDPTEQSVGFIPDETSLYNANKFYLDYRTFSMMKTEFKIVEDSRMRYHETIVNLLSKFLIEVNVGIRELKELYQAALRINRRTNDILSRRREYIENMINDIMSTNYIVDLPKLEEDGKRIDEEIAYMQSEIAKFKL